MYISEKRNEISISLSLVYSTEHSSIAARDWFLTDFILNVVICNAIPRGEAERSGASNSLCYRSAVDFTSILHKNTRTVYRLTFLFLKYIY